MRVLVEFISEGHKTTCYLYVQSIGLFVNVPNV